MARILFYGGCHSGIFKRVFGRFGLGAHDYEWLVNYELIRRGEPFPWDWVSQFDWVVYSPINNPGYATSELVSFCDARNIKHLSYPWLQWNGYHPGLRKDVFLGGTGWVNGRIRETAAASADFEAFYRKVSEPDFLHDFIKQNRDDSLNRISYEENYHEVDIRLFDLISKQYKERRLFFTPDHPSTYTYKYCIDIISQMIGISLEKSFYFSGQELQDIDREPIIPSVVSALELKFFDADYKCERLFGSDNISWKEYIKLYESIGTVVLRCRNNSYLKIAAGYTEERDRITVKAGDYMIVAEPVQAAPDGFGRFRTVNGGSIQWGSKAAPETFFAFVEHWDVVPLG